MSARGDPGARSTTVNGACRGLPSIIGPNCYDLGKKRGLLYSKSTSQSSNGNHYSNGVDGQGLNGCKLAEVNEQHGLPKSLADKPNGKLLDDKSLACTSSPNIGLLLDVTTGCTQSNGYAASGPRGSAWQPPNGRVSHGTCSPSPNCSVASSSRDVASKDIACLWLECSASCKTSLELTSHVTARHIQPMIDNGFFVCLWKECKVYNKPSSSHNWLLKHIHSHTGNKPFPCVIDGCQMSFATQNGLARHVPSHFKVERHKRGSPTDSPANDLRTADSPQLPCASSPSEKRSRSLRHRKHRKAVFAQQLIKKDDGYDQAAMEAIKSRLGNLEASRSLTSQGTALNLRTSPIGRRTTVGGSDHVLVRWKPGDILPDSWMALRQFARTRSFRFKSASLPTESKQELYDRFFRRLSRCKGRKRK